MKTLLLSIFLMMTVSTAYANSCDTVDEHPSSGVFTQDCISEILINYVTFHPNGYFIIEGPGDENIYVQGSRSTDNSFLLEAVGPQYSSKITPEVVKALISLGWALPGESGNFDLTIQVDQIFNQDAASILYKALYSYYPEATDVDLSYQMSDF